MYGTFFSLLQYSRFWVFAFRYYYPISNFSTIMQRRPLSLTVQQIQLDRTSVLCFYKSGTTKKWHNSHSRMTSPISVHKVLIQSMTTKETDQHNMTSVLPYAHLPMLFCWLVYSKSLHSVVLHSVEFGLVRFFKEYKKYCTVCI